MFNYNLNIRKIQQGSTYNSSWGENTDEMHKYSKCGKFLLKDLSWLKNHARKEKDKKGV